MNHLIKRLLVIFSLFFVGGETVFALSQHLPENHSVNGGLTIIPIDVPQRPDVFYNQSKIMVLPSSLPNQWLLVVGIPLDKTAAIQKLEVRKPHPASIPFHVSEKFYQTQSLKINDQRKVDPYEQDKARIDQESKEMAGLFANFSGNDPFAQPFIAPAHGPISSLFGLKRVYNNQSRPPHSGLDIAASDSSAVHAIAKGKVVATKDYFFTGNTVIVDHGMGLFSLYAHLKRIDVQTGQQLNQGAQVGLVGKTGRATGPHLHWSMVLNQTLVDPLLFVPVRVITAVPPSKTPEMNPPLKSAA